MANIYLVHAKAWNGSAEVTLNFSSSGYVTGTTNLPPSGVNHTFYEPRIIQPAMIQQECWNNGRIGGSSRIGFGTIELANTDGGLDYLTAYAFDGREITVIVGDVTNGGTPVWTVALTGKMAPPVIGIKTVTLYLRDRILELDKPVCTSVYAGTNSLPNGLEGTSDDIRGQRKPRVFGSVFNITPVLVNTSRLIYQVNDGAISSVCDVYDQGAALTKGTDYTDQTDMETNAPTAGNYRVLPAMGLFRINAMPDGELTCDVIQGAAASDRTAAQLTYDIAIIAGLSSGDISSADVTALDTANSAEMGAYYQDETTCIQAIDEIQNSVGAWWGFDRLGLLRMKQWLVPSGTPVATFTAAEIEELERVTDSNSVPTWRMSFEYLKNYTVQNSDLAAAVTIDRRAILGASTAVRIQSLTSVKTSNISAIESTVPSVISGTLYSGIKGRIVINRNTALNSAGTESTRQFNLYKVMRQRYDVTVFIDSTLISTINLGDVVRLQLNRFSMSSGVDFRIMGIKMDMNTKKCFLNLWS
jgi:hypothetical protein